MPWFFQHSASILSKAPGAGALTYEFFTGEFSIVFPTGVRNLDQG